MLIQCTKKLLDQLNIKPSVKVEENPLFSWHANLITLNSRKTVILVNDRNRYIVVLYDVKIWDFKNINKLIIEAVKEAFKSASIKNILHPRKNYSKILKLFQAWEFLAAGVL